MKRPRYSHCPPGQQFLPGKGGKLKPVHTPKLADADNCYCGSCRQRRLWTPEKRAAKAAAMRGVRIGGGTVRKIASRWTPAQEQTLKSLLGTMDTAGIAAELTRRFGWPRTEIAVRERIKVRKWSRLTVRPWSRVEVARALGVSYERVRDWVRAGWLTGTPWRLGGGHRTGAISQTFTVADVERFLRDRPALVGADQVRHPGLRTLVLALSRGERWAS